MKNLLSLAFLIAFGMAMGMPFLHAGEKVTPVGNGFGKAVSELAKSEPGAVAEHIEMMRNAE